MDWPLQSGSSEYSQAQERLLGAYIFSRAWILEATVLKKAALSLGSLPMPTDSFQCAILHSRCEAGADRQGHPVDLEETIGDFPRAGPEIAGDAASRLTASDAPAHHRLLRGADTVASLMTSSE